MLTRIDPPLPLQTPRGFAYAHFLDDCGDERDALWVCFCADGQIWWFPNPQVRACRNYSLERIGVETMVKQKVFKPGGHKGKLHRELGIAEGKKIPQKRLKQAEHSKNPEVARDAKRAETMKKWHHGKKRGKK